MPEKRAPYKGYVTVHGESYPTKHGKREIDLQVATRTDGNRVIQIKANVNDFDKESGYNLYLLSYDLLKKVIPLLVEINTKQEVEQELGIKIIGGNENGN
jgi:hypothetical protein